MIDVLKYRYYTAAVSLAICLSFVSYYLYLKQTRGYAFTYSVDFDGGTQVRLKFDKPVNSAVVRTALEKEGWHGASTREFANSQEMLVRVKDFSSDVKTLANRISQIIQAVVPDVSIEVLESESIRPSAVEALRFKSFMAIIFCLIAIMAYIALRYWSFAFAMGAFVSLIHDAIVVLALFLFLDREVSVNVIMAVIMLLGYSINDTIVIFSRIREKLAENAHLKKHMSIAQVITFSVNQTLRRTILLSVATALAALAMLLLGGESLRDLSLALFVGIVFGTYSSIYIASTVMMLFYADEKA
jgi:preprotein translocase subunit SecF